MEREIILSICIPTFNRAELVYKCVKHILEYKGNDIEVVVSNNASTDNTSELLGTIDDARLHVSSNDENIRAANWPLVVSKASGRFAALMSDEDEVCIENLPYFIDLLKSEKGRPLGAIIYSFPPMNKFYGEYCSENQHEATALAMKYGGHITCHILNTEIFRNTCMGYIEEIPPEVQWQILVAVSAKGTVLLSQTPLCLFGEIIPRPDAIASGVYIDTEIWGGWGAKTRFHTFATQTDLAFENFGYSEKTRVLLLKSVYTNVSTNTHFLISVADTSEHPEIHQIGIIRDVLRYGLSEVKTEIINLFAKCMDHMTERTADPEWELIKQVFTSAINEDFTVSIPEGLSRNSRIWIGDILFTAVFSRFDYHLNYSVLETSDTTVMAEMLKHDDYDSVINYKKLSTHRALFLRGRAFLKKDRFEEAAQCFRDFLWVAENPENIGDIITGALSVQHAYYYLGYICQKCGRPYEAVKWFAKCHELTYGLLIGENLVSNRLGISE